MSNTNILISILIIVILIEILYEYIYYIIMFFFMLCYLNFLVFNCNFILVNICVFVYSSIYLYYLHTNYLFLLYLIKLANLPIIFVLTIYLSCFFTIYLNLSLYTIYHHNFCLESIYYLDNNFPLSKFCNKYLIRYYNLYMYNIAICITKNTMSSVLYSYKAKSTRVLLLKDYVHCVNLNLSMDTYTIPYVRITGDSHYLNIIYYLR